MRSQLGWFTLILALAFSGALLVALSLNTIDGTSSELERVPREVMAFFGFGIPMIASGIGVGAIWFDHKNKLKMLGWVGILLGLAFGVSLFFRMRVFVFGDISSATEFSFVLGLLANGIPMLLCGAFGVRALFESENKQSCR